jgi:Glycosyl hydrolases family 35
MSSSSSFRQVPNDITGFPSYQSYAGTPYRVSYDGRSLLLNGNQRALFFGGSMHPVRATRGTWEAALDLAVIQGLNLITIYVMWSAHQPFADTIPFDWSLLFSPTSSDDGVVVAWTLAEAIQVAADRGFFVHIRVGPYVCAEYSYGGIPEWVPILASQKNQSMAMRRPNIAWMDAMEKYLRNVIGYLQDHQLFADQGGSIILAQIENELGEDGNLIPERQDLWALVEPSQGRFVPNDGPIPATTTTTTRRVATLQDYADWCGRVVQTLAPNVIWTMCNGLSAQTTIETYNGFLDSTAWLDHHGDNGRIQLDQPALWTEDEGAFRFLFLDFSVNNVCLCFAISNNVFHPVAIIRRISNLGRPTRPSVRICMGCHGPIDGIYGTALVCPGRFAHKLLHVVGWIQSRPHGRGWHCQPVRARIALVSIRRTTGT